MKTVKLGDVLLKTSTIKWKEQPQVRTFSYIDLTSVDRSKHEITQTSDINTKNAPSRAQKIIMSGDVIFGTTRPTLNRLCIVPKEYDKQICSTGFCVLRANPEVITPGFIYYLLTTKDFLEYIEATQRGTSYPAVTDKDVKQFEFTLPSLEEQRRIVARLDAVFEKIDRAIELTEKNIVNTENLFNSYLKDLFNNPPQNWRSSALKEITSKIGSGATPKGGKGSYKTEGIALVRSMNVHDKQFKYDQLAYIDEDQAQKLQNVSLENGDVLLNITGASVARCNIVPDDCIPGRVNQHVSIIRLNKSLLLPDFLHYQLISEKQKKLLLGIGNGKGSTRQAITKTQIQDFIVHYPVLLNEQQRIIDELKKISDSSGTLLEKYHRKKAYLESLKQSLLMQAFSTTNTV